ncbi:MAG TPA: rhomboid family intramembrane serine protease [Pirellulales bacterium]|jgi:GlpG protein
MRQIGNVANVREATRLIDYLAAQGIRARSDEKPTDAGIAVWTYEEDQRERAQALLAEFNLNPADARYDEAAGKARAVALAEAERDRQARRNLIDVRARWSSNDVRSRPVTLVLALVCLFVAVTTRFGNRAESEWLIDQLMITPVKKIPLAEAPRGVMDQAGFEGFTSRRDAVKINEGIGATLRYQPWRLVTPIFLHFGLPHFLFNMMALFTFGSQIEMRRGAWFMLFLTIVVAAISNWAQYDLGGENVNRSFGGMSGVVYGMFGYIWMKSRYDPASRFYMPHNGVLWMLGWLVVCMLGIFGSVANVAHIVGLAMGMILGAAPTFWNDMLRDVRLRRFQKP